MPGAWKLIKDSFGVQRPILVMHKNLQPGLQENLFGLFYRKKEAHRYLAAVAKKYHLCYALLGLEKVEAGRSCFGYQVMVVVDKWCYLGVASDHDELYELASRINICL